MFPLKKPKDTVPAMLSPGEMVLTPEQQAAVKPTDPDALLPEQLQRLAFMRGEAQHFRRGGNVERRGGFRGLGSLDDQIGVSQWLERNNFPADWGSGRGNLWDRMRGVDFPPANESTDWNYGQGPSVEFPRHNDSAGLGQGGPGSNFFFGPHGGPSVYPTYYVDYGDMGWFPHAQEPGRNMVGGDSGLPGGVFGGFSPLAGAGMGTPGMGGSLGGSGYDYKKQLK